MLKHLLKDSMEKIEKTLLYSKQPVYYSSVTLDRRIHNGLTTGFATTRMTAAELTTLKINNTKDLNIDEWITKFQDQLKNEYVYRVPFKYFCNLEKINLPLKIDSRIKCHLEKEMKRLFESRKVLASTASKTPAPDAKIIFTKAPFVQYEQILLDKNF